MARGRMSHKKKVFPFSHGLVSLFLGSMQDEDIGFDTVEAALETE